MTLDDVLPAPHFRERHARRIGAPPPAVWAALQELRLGDSPLARALMGLRTFPARLGGHEPPPMVSGRFVEDGPLPVLVAEPPRMILLGGVLQPWKLGRGAEPPDLDPPALRAFSDPGWVKCAMDFVLVADGDGTTLRTETRVQATDPRTWARFALYWTLIRAGSGLIRRGLLRAVARHAEAPASMSSPRRRS